MKPCPGPPTRPTPQGTGARPYPGPITAGSQVGHELYREITTYAPWDWTRGERLVALVIADHCHDRTRRTRRPLPRYVLCQETGYTAEGLKRVLQRLAGRGFEFRLGHGPGKDGREVFSARGHTVDYQVPHMPKGGTRVPPLPIPVPVDNPEKGGTQIPPLAEKGGTGVPPYQEKGGTGVPERGYGGTPLTPLTPSTYGSVVGGAVEVARGSPGQEQRREVDVEGELAAIRRGRMTAIEYAAWQAAESRRQRLAAEQEPNRYQQREENGNV